MQDILRPVLNESSENCINPFVLKPQGRKLSSSLHVGHPNIELMLLAYMERTKTYQQLVKLGFWACSLYVSVCFWQYDCFHEAYALFVAWESIIRCMKSVGRLCFLKPTLFYRVLKHCRIQAREVPDFISGHRCSSLPERNWAYSKEYKERKG